MKAGDITIHKILQPDGSAKVRPVLLLKQVPPYGDWIVCAVSAQLQQEIKGFDWLLLQTDTAFAATGLKTSSLIRLGFINTISKKVLPGPIGSIDKKTIGLLLQRLADFLIK